MSDAPAAQAADDTPRHNEGPGLESWDAWSPREFAARVGDADVAWCVVGGWAIDLHLGEVTREHEDLEVGVPRGEHVALRAALRGCEFFSVGDGEIRRLGAADALGDDLHQCWALDEGGAWRVDLMAEPGDRATWTCRRDPRLSMPRGLAVRRSADGVPYLCPEAVLLFKAKAHRDKDEADLAACVPTLDARATAWLRDAIELVHPGHPWVDRIG